ncbi:MAG: hypothetical protein WC022_00370 [Parcubacteria group bacterium]
METFKKQNRVDSVIRLKEKSLQKTDLSAPSENSSILFSKYGKTKNFSTDNLRIHFIKNDRKPDFSSLDGFLRYEKRVSVRNAFRHRQHIFEMIKEKYGNYSAYFEDAFRHPFEGMSMVKMWNVSIVGSLVIGMFLMTFVYRYLGQGAAAEVSVSSNMEVTTQEILDSQKSQVLGVDTEKVDISVDATQVENYVSQIMQDYQDKAGSTKQLEEEISGMVKGTPMEQMVPYIAQQDRMVAAFMVGIARQESSWGVHVPVDSEGNDCFNYWGYRGKRARMGTGGHTCFDSPKDAVETVAKRLSFLVSSEKLTTPGEMVVVWKCGYDCSWDKPEAVARWVDSVNYYFKQFNDEE